LCLQETKCTDDQFPALALQAAGYYAGLFTGEKSYNGVAIVSKLKLSRRASIAPATEVADPQAARDCSGPSVGHPCFFRFIAPERPGGRFSSLRIQITLVSPPAEIASPKEKSGGRCGVRWTSRRAGRHRTFTMQIYGVGAIMCSAGETRAAFQQCVKSALAATHCRIHHKEGETFQLVGLSDGARLKEIRGPAHRRDFWLPKN